jgi:hypothetical protein
MSHPKTAIAPVRITRTLFGVLALGACALLMTNELGCSTSEGTNDGEGGSSGVAGHGPAGANGSGNGGSTAGGEGGRIAGGEGGRIVGGGEGGRIVGGEGGRVAAGEGGRTAGGEGGRIATGGRGGGTVTGGRGGGTVTSGRGGGTAAGGTGGTTTGGTGGAGDATFAAVAEILMTSCTAAKCHDGASGNAKTDLRNNSGLYARIVNAAQTGEMGTACNGKILVVPSQPTMSLLYQKVTGTGIPSGCGDRMPDGCPTTKTPCLTTAQTNTIRDWIMAGAPM